MLVQQRIVFVVQGLVLLRALSSLEWHHCRLLLDSRTQTVLYSQVPLDRGILDLLRRFFGCQTEQSCRDRRALGSRSDDCDWPSFLSLEEQNERIQWSLSIPVTYCTAEIDWYIMLNLKPVYRTPFAGTFTICAQEL